MSHKTAFKNVTKLILISFIFATNFICWCQCVTSSNGPPNIIFILADDLGWNDVGFHGSNQIPTPNIDALAYSGVILNKYYVHPICTPSRSALMTGKYPIHTGMQHGVLYGAEPRGLPLTEKLLPEYLKDLGYVNHIVGKWHLGSYKKEYLPLHRGFQSHLGYWTGHQDYFDHTAEEHGVWGLDMRRGMDIAWDLHGKYSTDVFTNEAAKIISRHNSSAPLFLYVAHAAVHSGNTYNYLPAPDNVVAKFTNIKNFKRRKFAAMMSKLDDSVGDIVNALSKANMLSNSIIIFSTDNGGPAGGFNDNHASNWPLKGVKNTLWEGGLRGAGLIWSPLLKARKRVSTQAMHMVDWLPTLYTAAGGDTENIIVGLDAMDMWKTLSEGHPSERAETLHSIDDIWRSAAVTVDNWKLVLGTNYDGGWDHWYGPAGRDGSYNISQVMDSPAGIAVRKIFDDLNPEIITDIRNDALVNCSSEVESIACNALMRPCMYNIADDPCERRNLAELPEHQETLEFLMKVMQKYNNTAVPPGNKPLDPKGDPKFWDYTWTNFGDEQYYSSFIST